MNTAVEKLDALRKAARTQDWEAGLTLSESLLAEPSAESDVLPEALRLRGVCYLQSGKIEDSRACLRMCVEEAPEKQSGYLEWINAEERFENRELSRRILNAGLEHAAEQAELRILQSAIIDRPTLSVCMIVKNEGEFLEQCLTSVRDIADEIILVDTGSTDRTVEIAQTFGCKVFHQEWEGDFSKHRNYSLEQATGDWILIIDADEELDRAGKAELETALKQTDCPIVSLTVYNVGSQGGGSATALPSVRLFRRDLNLRYDGIVHNRLLFQSDTRQLRLPVRITHYGYDLSPEKMKRKHERSKGLLLKQIADNPDDYFAHFNFAQLIRAESSFGSSEEAELALNHARRTIELTDPTSSSELPFHTMAHHQAATALYSLKDFASAERYCRQALKFKPGYLDAVITLGYIYLNSGRLDKAEIEFKNYLHLQSEFDENAASDGMIIIHLQSRHNAYYSLGILAESRADWDSAARMFEHADSVSPGFLDSQGRRGWALLHCDQLEAGRECFKLQQESDSSQVISYIGLAEVHTRSGAVDLAIAELRGGLARATDTCAIYTKLVDLYTASTDVQAALKVAEEAMELYPENTALLTAYGAALTRGQRLQEAVETYQCAERLDPGLVEPALGLANAYLLSGDNESAVRWFAETLSRDPNLGWAKRNLAIAYSRLGKCEEALPHLTAYVNSAPEDFQARTILGALTLQAGEKSDALGVFEELVRDYPDNPEALLALADCYLALGSKESATIGYQRLLAVHPEHQIARERLQSLGVKRGA